MKDIPKTEEGWKKKLTLRQFNVLRNKATEPAFSGEYLDNKARGVYLCAGCDSELFSSKTKFNLGSGWPSFWDVISEKSIKTKPDDEDKTKTEVLCICCKGHLGHMFDDGPKPTGKRYSINSVALKFKPAEDGI